MHGVYVVKTLKNPKKDTCTLYQLTFALLYTFDAYICTHSFTNYDKINYVNNRFVMISIHAGNACDLAQVYVLKVLQKFV